jgi:hypothetical protein
MTIKHFVNNKRGLAADTKPSATNLFPVLFLETDTGRTLTSIDGTTVKTLTGFDKPESIYNKIINSEKNNVQIESIEDSPFGQNAKVKGGHIPAATPGTSFYGVMDINGITLSNPLSCNIQEGVGVVAQYYSETANDIIGFRTTVPFVNRSIPSYFKFEVAGDSTRMLIGFSTRSLFDPSFGLSDTDTGVIMGYTKVEPNFSVFHNDGTGTKVTTQLPIGKDDQLHIFEFNLNPTNIICIMDGLYQVTMTTKIPAVTDNLYFMCYGIV